MAGDVADHDRRDADDDQGDLGRFTEAKRDEQDGQERDRRDHRNTCYEWSEGGAHRGQRAQDKADQQRHQCGDGKAKAQTLEAGEGIGPEHHAAR